MISGVDSLMPLIHLPIVEEHLSCLEVLAVMNKVTISRISGILPITSSILFFPHNIIIFLFYFLFFLIYIQIS